MRRVSFIEPDGIQKGWKSRVRNTPAISSAQNSVLMTSQTLCAISVLRAAAAGSRPGGASMSRRTRRVKGT